MTRMNKNISIVSIAFFAFGLFSCSNIQNNDSYAARVETAAANFNIAFVTLSLDETALSKTLLPNVQSAVFTDLVLKGTMQGESEKILGTWSNLASMKTASVPVAIGIWSFTLEAKSDESSFSATLQKEIVVGQNKLSFGLTLTDIGSGRGSFSLTLSFATASNGQNVSNVVGSLENMSGLVVSGYDSNSLAVSSKTVTFTGSDIAAGTYRAKIKFYASVNGSDVEIASWSEIVQIASGFTSSASRIIESFDDLYTITYELNGGTFTAETVFPETFCRKSGKITLPQSVERNYYTFSGWHTDALCADNNKISEIENKTDDIVVYAKWTPIVYNITYDIDSDSTIKSYTVEDDITLTDLHGEGITFYGWYDNNKYTGTALTGWKAGEKHSDVMLYADCTIDFSANESDIVTKITEMKKSGTIKASGIFSVELMTEINTALNKVDKASPKIFVSFDFESVYMPIEWTLKNHSSLFSIVIKDISSRHISGQFKDCKSLETVTIKSGVIGPGCFTGCSALKNISLPASLENIYEFTFSNCAELETIEIPGTVESIDKGVFDGCSSLKNVTLPNGLKTLSDSLFRECSSLESITIPETVTTIGGYAFCGCSMLKNISIPSSVTSIGQCAFGECSLFETIVVPENVTSIGRWCFEKCSALKSMILPPKITKIEAELFRYCSSLEYIKIPAGVSYIDSTVFYECDSLRDVVFDDVVNPWYWEYSVNQTAYEPKDSNRLGSMSSDATLNANLLKTYYADRDKYVLYKLQE